MNNEPRPCWYISEQVLGRYQTEGAALPTQFKAAEYFLAAVHTDSRLEGGLGRYDHPNPFFTRMENGLTYFDDYHAGKKLYFTFDKINLFEVIEVHPESYLRFVLERTDTPVEFAPAFMQARDPDEEAMLLDLAADNADFKEYVADFTQRQQRANQFLSNVDFIDNEIRVFKEKGMVRNHVAIRVNDLPFIEPFNIDSYKLKAFEYVRRGHNVRVSQLIAQARNECEKEKMKQLAEFGTLVAHTPCDPFSLDGLVRRAIRQGVGFALFVKYLTDHLPVEDTKLTSRASQPTASAYHFESIFTNPAAALLCKELLEDLEITENGQNILTKGKLGLLAGAIVALSRAPGMLKRDRMPEMALLEHFNAHLGTTFASVRKRSNKYNHAVDQAERFLKTNRSRK